jgi:mannosyltransferase OCH1-like enzyme
MQINVKNYNQVTIPRNIIQTGKHSRLGTRSFQSFKRLNPNHSYFFYDDTQALEFVRKHMPPDIIHIYESMPAPILKADYFRYISIYKLGGVYSDIDTDCLRPIDTWTDNYTNVGLIVGIEAESPTWKKHYARPLQLCQWTFAGIPNHPILKRMIENIVKQTKKFHNSTPNVSVVMEWTGPGLWTDTIFGYLNETHHVEWPTLSKLQYGRLIGDVYILPITAFQPNGFNMGAKGERDIEARTKHHFHGNWKKHPEKKNKISYFRRFHRKH